MKNRAVKSLLAILHFKHHAGSLLTRSVTPMPCGLFNQWLFCKQEVMTCLSDENNHTGICWDDKQGENTS